MSKITLSAIGALLLLASAGAAGAGNQATALNAPATEFKAQYDGPYDPDQYGAPGPGAHGFEAPHASGSRRGGFVSYHGFKLDVMAGGDSSVASNALAGAEHQIDIVDEVSLSTSNLRLFQSLPIRISGRLFGGGHFSGGHEVEIGGAAVTDNRPILLHEYMHAYHFFKLPGRFKNPDVLRFYEEATSQGLYESGSYMMSNPAEFFAVTASCYLWGTVAREPYNREAIRSKQPDYYAFLGQLFGRVGAAMTDAEHHS